MAKRLFFPPSISCYPYATIAAMPVSIACWFRRGSSSVGDRVLVQLADYTGGTAGLSLYLANFTDRVRAYTQTSTGTTAQAGLGDNPPTTGRWNHAAAVFASDSSRVAYQNGVASGTDTTSLPLGSNLDSLYIATSYVAQTALNNHAGIAHVCVWSEALSGGEIQALSRGLHPLNVRPHAVISYHPLDDKADLLFCDRNRRGNRYPAINGSTGTVGEYVGPPLRSNGNLDLYWMGATSSSPPPPPASSGNLLLLGVG